MNQTSENNVWFVYDGDCPICRMAAQALRIKKAVGNLQLLDARKEKSHQIVQEINKRKLSLDEGMVIKFNDKYYHGADALQIMALLGTNQGWFNRINYLLFRSKFLSKISYPAMRSIRNMILRLNGISKIDQN